MDYSPDGQRLALGTSAFSILLWDLQSDKPNVKLEGHTGVVYSVAYSSCGKWILSGSRDKTARLWSGEVDSWSCVAVVSGFSEPVTSVAWNPVVPMEFVTGSDDGSVRVWRISSAKAGVISVRMHWGSHIGQLCAADLTFKGAIGLNPIYRKLLVQRGAIDNSLLPEGDDRLVHSYHWDLPTAPNRTDPAQQYSDTTRAMSDALSRSLDVIKGQRPNVGRQSIFVPTLAKASLQASDDDVFPLMNKVQEFLASDQQFMLVLGDSGSGKSTFARHLECQLWSSYENHGPVPLFIDFTTIDQLGEYSIEKQLSTYDISDDQIQELKLHCQFVIICDGYGESQQCVNVYKKNKLIQIGQWKAKMIVTCKSQYLGQDYRSHFIPEGNDLYNRQTTNLFREAVITPFSKEQIESYVEQYVSLDPRTWTTKDYMDKLITIPNLMDLVKNPFLLSLSLKALPGVTEDQQDLSAIKITRVQLYDTFVRRWLDVNSRRLHQIVLPKEDRDVQDRLLEAGFITNGIAFSKRLATAIFEQQDGNPVVHSRRVMFFDASNILFKRSLLAEPSVIQFLCERVKQHPDFEKQLLAIIEQSKIDATVATAAANATTILVRAEVPFNSSDLRGIRTLGADSFQSQFDTFESQIKYAQSRRNDLQAVVLVEEQMKQVDLSNAQMEK
ncbi:hypothetical protein BGZ90_003551 [Linnemannia elongata]|nr:hypothetical protein BGZ90_003551 [Linnemannia elongata]